MTPTTKPTPSPTLAAALEHAYRTRWVHARDGGKSLYSQAQAAVKDLTVSHQNGAALCIMRPDWTVSTLPQWAIESATASWYQQGLSPATITKRLNCLSVMGVSVEGMRPKKDRKLQWWLTPAWEDTVVALLNTGGTALPTSAEAALAAHIRWTTRTGLRVEETLRLRGEHFSAGFTEVTVPGTKTAISQATLPLGVEAGEAGRSILAAGFRDYGSLEAAWRVLRVAMGWPEGATLKALRRSAARYLHVECNMPIHMVQAYLRHESLDTTLGYLRLTGGYGTEEMRRYLK